jgi:preprotein translocase subunit SecG
MVYTLITIIVVIASILLVGIVLVQNSKGGGLASSFQSQNQIMGVKKTTDFVEKATWVLVSVVVVLSIASAAFYPREIATEDSQLRSQVEEMLPANSDAE